MGFQLFWNFLSCFVFFVIADDIYRDIYTPLTYARPCVRLLHKDGVVGCTTPMSGLSGTLRLLLEDQDIQALLSSAPSYSVGLAMAPLVFNRTSVDLLQAKLNIAGIAVLNAAPPTPGYSTDSTWPQSDLDLHNTSNNNFVWNTYGNGMYAENYSFAMVVLSDQQESDVVQLMAKENEDSIKNNKFAANAIEFNYYMPAQTSSLDCLENRKCLPVGGYSVWVPFGPTGVNTSQRQVFAIAGADSTSLFHDLAIGAIADTSAVIALLTTAATLAKVNVMTLEKQIVLALFMGESWGYVGSRMFVQDITNFNCMSNSSNSCDEPYRPSTEFTKLNLSNIDRLFELNQVVGNKTMYLHREHDNNSETTQMITELLNLSTSLNLKTITVATASTNTPGVPPASVQAFLKQRPTTPTVVLADHFSNYSNLYYHSIFDQGPTSLTIISDILNTICDVSTLTAQFLYQSAGGNNVTEKALLRADCDLVASLWDCLTKDFTCELVQKYLGPMTRKTPPDPVTHYTSVYQLMKRIYMTDMPHFYHDFLHEQVNASLALAPPSSRALVNDSFGAQYHDAVDPALVFDYTTDKWTWNLTDLAINYAPVWAESNWAENIGSRVYVMENPSVEIFMLLAGLGVIAVTTGVTIYSQRLCNKRFKNL